MYRSSSWNRFSDEYYSHASPPSAKPGQGLRISSSFDAGNELPSYDPVAEMAKRERARVKLAETAVHVIPFVLLLCAVVLWFFSNPEIDMGMRMETMGGKIQALTIEGEIENELDPTQNRNDVLPLMETTAPLFDSSHDPVISHNLGT